MIVTGTTEISKNVYEIHVNELYYKVYRFKARLFRVTLNNRFMFNLRAFSIEKVTEYLSKMDYDDLKTKPVED